MTDLDFISTTAIIMHQDAQGVTFRKTRIEKFYQTFMPDEDFETVAQLKNLTTGEIIEFRTFRGAVYRQVPSRAREVSGGMVYLRLPAIEAEQTVSAGAPKLNRADLDTLAFQGGLWVRAQMPTYRVVQTTESLKVVAGWEEHEGIEFNALQQADAVACALRLGNEANLPMHQTHQITLTDQSSAGPAAATTDAGAVLNTVRQQLSPIMEATALLQAAVEEREIIERLRNLEHLVESLKADAVKASMLTAA